MKKLYSAFSTLVLGILVASLAFGQPAMLTGVPGNTTTLSNVTARIDAASDNKAFLWIPATDLSSFSAAKEFKGWGTVLKTATVASNYTASHRGDFTATNAFFEANATDLSAYVGTDAGSTPYKIRLVDSAGKIAWGYVGAGGSGETLATTGGPLNDGNLVTNGTFDSDTGWTNGGNWTITGGVATHAGVNDGSYIYQTVGTNTNKLFKYSIDLTCTNDYIKVRIFDNYSGSLSPSGTYVGYIAASTSQLVQVRYQGANLTSVSVDNYSVKQVLDPPASSSGGLHIVSTFKGSTRNWASIESGFNPNSIATYSIYLAADRPRLSLYDSANQKWIQGWMGSVGAGEAKAAAKNVVGITKANPGVVTLSAGHGYTDNMLVYFSGLTEMTDLNTTYRVLYGNSGDTFQIPDTSSYAAAETTGGSCIQRVTEPPATAVTVYTTRTGSSRGWARKDSGFAYNSSTLKVIIDQE